MTTIDDLLELSGRGLRDRVANGYPVDPDWLADRQMNGVALAVPAIARPFAWVKFRKTFKREADGSLRGWNVQCEQTPLDRPWTHVVRNGIPVTYGHYRVRGTDGLKMPGAYGNGLMIDYTVGGNRLLDPMNFILDPLVAVHEGDSELLLGFSYLSVGPAQLILPAYFALVGGDPLDHDATPPR